MLNKCFFFGTCYFLSLTNVRLCCYVMTYNPSFDTILTGVAFPIYLCMFAPVWGGVLPFILWLLLQTHTLTPPPLQQPPLPPPPPPPAMTMCCCWCCVPGPCLWWPVCDIWCVSRWCWSLWIVGAWRREWRRKRREIHRGWWRRTSHLSGRGHPTSSM